MKLWLQIAVVVLLALIYAEVRTPPLRDEARKLWLHMKAVGQEEERPARSGGSGIGDAYAEDLLRAMSAAPASAPSR